MPTFLDEAQITGAPAASPSAAPTSSIPKGATFLDEEAITGVSSFETQAKEKLTLKGAAKDIAQGIGERLAGSAAQISDMFTGIGKQVLGSAVYWGARTGVQATTGESKTAATAAQMAKDTVFPAEISAPWSKVAEALGPQAQEAYNNNPVAWIMGKVGEVIDKGAGAAAKSTGLQTEDFVALADQFMGSLGAKAVKPAVKAAFDKRVAEARKPAAPLNEPTLASPPEVPPAPDTSVPYDTSPAAPSAEVTAARRVELDAKIKAAAKAKETLNKQVKDAAKYTRMAEKLDEGDPLRSTLEERAQLSLEEASRIKTEQEAARKAAAEAETKAAGPTAEQRLGGTAYDVSPEARALRNESAAEIARISETPGHLRSAEDLIQMRDAVKRAKEAGFIDPEAAKRFGITFAGVGAAGYGATQIWKELDPESYDEWKKKAKKALGAPEDGPKEFQKAFPEGKMFTSFEDMGPALGVSLLLGGAIKGKGGMWHPEAVERLSSPLRDTLTSGAELAERMNAFNRSGAPRSEYIEHPNDVWAIKAVRNYLNKHAGTEGDPLAKVELPSGRTWRAAMDESIKGNPNKEYTDGETGRVLDLPNTPLEETVWNIGPRNRNGIIELKDYLFHVGDFLRQNVNPAKLQQYDLVRAVKETAANDARVAKEMEKAAASLMKDMPVYKDYGDGMKWVELKLPEKLTEEQTKGVKATEEFKNSWIGKEKDKYVAVDDKGNPVVNTYTGEPHLATTPEEAHLAGQLAQEGNQMGHCVGGYCEGVASGETRILSLRDAKGWSHVTVEIDPGSRRGFASNESILQIKGKQNRAPDAKYLPYVQDLVKGGKWGEVGDLQNTRLIKMENGTYKSPEDFKDTGTQGSVDPRLLAAAGGVAAYAAMNPDQAQNLAGLGLLALPVKKFAQGMLAVAKRMDYVAGATSTRLGNISPALKLRAREYERRVLEQTEQALTKAHPFLQVIAKEKPGSALDMALVDDPAKVRAVLKDDPQGLKAWSAVEGMLKTFEQTHKELGRFKEGLSNYFPRIVDDLEGLKKALGQEERTSLEEALVEANALMIKTRQRGLTDVETSIIVNNSLTAKGKSQLPGFAQQREVKTVTEELRPFYANPADSLLRYLSAAIQDAEMAKFFGKDLAQRKVGGKLATDVDASIGNIVTKELKSGRLNYDQVNELRSLLESRFKGGERQMSGPLQDIRNASNVALLGQFGSAATQIGDSVMTNYHHGMVPTLQAVGQKLTGSSQVTGREFGLVNHIAEELGSNRYTGHALQLVFKANGFGAIDQFAKGLNLNAGLIKNQRLAQTLQGRATLAERYAEAFGDEFQPLLQDLIRREATPRVKSLLFSELSDAQPISKMEMPQAYLDHPNGRLMYQMKTYMLKQLDVIRRDAYNEWKAGHKVVAMKNLVAVASALALSNIPGDVVKNWLSGRDDGLDKIDYTEALLRNFGVSRFSLDQVASGKPLEVARDIALPPYKHYQELINAATTGKSQDQAKAAKYIPLVGRAYYDRELGGNEARLAADAKRLRIQLRDEREAANPALKTERLDRLEMKRQKALNKARQP